tara:strand:+ start:16 stop:648 length:633 start_codon:yes stop_codon:yes gene_type:complete
MSSQNSNRQQQRRGKGKRRFKKPKKQPPKKIDWKTYVPPGGKEWYEKNREKLRDNVNEYMRLIHLNRSIVSEDLDKKEGYHDNFYLPKSCMGKKEIVECPANVVKDLGWVFDKESNKFYHNQYGNCSFNAGYSYWGGDKYIVPLSNKNDTKGLGYLYKISVGGSFCEMYQNKMSDFWSSRRGKRLDKYISYRKSRDARNNEFTSKNVQTK